MAHVIPELPVLAEDNSMLSRKFGREVANYFSGNPLNRISFLRTDYGFLRAAFAHPSASFLLMDNLSPLAKDAANLSYVTRDVVTPLTGEEPFKKSESEQVKEFNSTITKPVILFLGIDEKKPGFEYREYKGKPFFAVDITPKGTIADKAKSIADIVKANGVSFIDGRRLLSLNAPEGSYYLTHLCERRMYSPSSSGDIRRGPCLTGLEQSEPILWRLRSVDHVHQRWVETRLPSCRLGRRP